MLRILLLTEGGVDAGMGHVVRLIPIVQELKKLEMDCDWKINGDSTVFKLISDKGSVEIVNWQEQNISTLALEKYTCILIDSLNINETFLEKLKKSHLKVIVVTDGILPAFNIDLNIDWSIKTQIEIQDTIQGKNLLFGVKYTPLRSIFKNPPVKKINHEIRDVLLTLGGSDIRNLTPALMKFLLDMGMDFRNLHVIIGPGFSETTCRAIEKIQDERIRLYINPEDKIIFELMSLCDIAIAAGGHTVYELATMGVPVIHILVVDNQLYDAPWESAGFTCLAGMYDRKNFYENLRKCINAVQDFSIREKKSRAGQSLIQGDGAFLLAQRIKALAASN